MMEWLHKHTQLWDHDVFQWWVVIGWVGNAIFFTRFFVQWYATEKKRRVVVPLAFWWLSITGSLILLAYSLHKHDLVFIFAYAFTWIPYVRNLIIHRRHADAQVTCGACNAVCPPNSNFCFACGARLNASPIESSDHAPR
jgi:lipid-A-disaccharide synthase-like uncharacterized protein